MLQSINAIFISTKNIEKLIEFYKALGVPLKVNDHGGGLHAEADFGDIHFALQSWESHDKPASNVCFSFHVPNLEEYCGVLEKKGVSIASPPTPLPFGGVLAEVFDPDGNRIFLTRWQSNEEYQRNFPGHS